MATKINSSIAEPISNFVQSRAPAVPAPIIYLGEFDGVLFIGDPHVSPKPIGRRKDDYLKSVLTKLEFSAEYANAHNLLPICLGDLFHRENVNSLTALNRLVCTLNLFHTKLIVLDGNHDRSSSPILHEGTALQLLLNTKTVLVPENVGLAYRASIEGQLVDIHMYPHGVTLPDTVPQSENLTFAVTHHDLAFGSTYPGSQELKSIPGIDMVVNGHMHDTKPSELRGATYWHNPGNIENLSIDLVDFVPKVWRWAPSATCASLEGIQLPHGTDIFDLQGVSVEAENPEEAVRILESSEFASSIRATEAEQASKTEDASVFKDDVTEILEVSSVSPAAKALVRLLTQTVVDEAESAAMSS